MDDDDYVYEWTRGDKVADVVVRFSHFLGLFPAACMISETWSDQQAGRGTTVTRLLFTISVFTSIYLLTRILGTLPVDSQEEESWGNLGNAFTCNAQAFLFVVGGTGLLFFDMMLSLVYVLMVCYGWSNDKLVKLEKFAQPLLWIIVVGFGLAGWVFGAYWGYEDNCWIDPESTVVGYYLFWAYVALMYVPILTAAVSAIMIYRAVKRLEQKNSRYVFGRQLPTSPSSRSATSTTPSSSARSLMSSIRNMRNFITASSSRASNSDDVFARSRKVAYQGLWWTSTLMVTLPNNIVLIVWIFSGRYHFHVGLWTEVLTGALPLAYLIVFLRTRSECRTRLGKLAHRNLSWIYASSKRSNHNQANANEMAVQEKRDEQPNQVENNSNNARPDVVADDEEGVM